MYVMHVAPPLALLLLVALLIVQVLLRRVVSPGVVLLERDLASHTAVVTGACSGIGRETAALLLRLNASVILGCRDVAKGKRVCDDLEEAQRTSLHLASSTRRCVSLRLDLASFASVVDFVASVSSYGIVPNILVNNAAVRQDLQATTEDGLEVQYQVNHLSHFLLVDRLLPLMLRSTKRVRVLHVSSSAHAFGSIDREAYSREVGNTDPQLFARAMASRIEGVYGDTKLMQMLFSRELQRRFDSAFADPSTRPLSVSLHPGFVATNIGHSDHRWLQWAVLVLRPLLARSAAEGALTSLAACTADLAGGEYLDNGVPAAPSPLALDHADATWVWETSLSIVRAADSGTGYFH